MCHLYVFSASSICVLYSVLYIYMFSIEEHLLILCHLYMSPRGSAELSLARAHALSLSHSPLSLALLRAVARLLQLLFQRRPLPCILRVRHVREE